MGAEIVSVAPRLDSSVTVLLGTKFPRSSLRVTVTVAVLVPSLATTGGRASTVEAAPSAGSNIRNQSTDCTAVEGKTRNKLCTPLTRASGTGVLAGLESADELAGGRVEPQFHQRAAGGIGC